MSRICQICGKGPRAGRKIARRGMAKKKGGAGQKITGISGRRFMVNLQTKKVIINGKVKRMRICTKCLKAGKINKTVSA